MSIPDSSGAPRFLLLFVDGVGLAPAAAGNPLARVPMPALAAILGGPLTLESVGARPDARLDPLDATLGVPGLPQSATGQTALFTGENAPALLGRHVSAYPGPRLAELLASHSLLARAERAGAAATFANPFPAGYFAEVEAGRRRHSATTLAALAMERPLRTLEELAAGAACTWDVTGEAFAALGVARVEPEEAGARLARLAGRHRLTLWETFMTDLAGHRRFGWTAERALARLDGLLAGIRSARVEGLTVLLFSDHGNLEESGHDRHTRNPVPLLSFGPHAAALAGLSRIDELAPRLLASLTR
jgi:hypothetical protein